MSKSSESSWGMGICEVLTIVFVALKLTGNIAWSWWWVLSPIWIPIAIAVVVVVIAVVIATIVETVHYIRDKRRARLVLQALREGRTQ